MTKATARAYAIQGLVKYHGLKDPRQRIPYHDSISVCTKALPTVTTVETSTNISRDVYRVNGKVLSEKEQARIRVVLNRLRKLGRHDNVHVRVESRNPDVNGKGLGFSASGFAALGLAASTALNMSFRPRILSQIVRLGAGSAARSLVGGFSIWYADRNGLSYAEQLAPADAVDLRTVIVPVSSGLKTDRAHEDSVQSPFYKARLEYLRRMLPKMKSAITRRNVRGISRLAEVDTLNLHAVTMTGKTGMIAMNPVSLTVIEEVRTLRDEQEVPAWFSLDTGPSVFVNTTADAESIVRRRLGKLLKDRLVLTSKPGGPAELLDKHLF